MGIFTGIAPGVTELFLSEGTIHALLCRAAPSFFTRSISKAHIIKCFYCDTENEGGEFCISCNSPLEDGYRFAGLYYLGQKVWVK